MPGPLQSDLHVDQMLTNMSIGYSNPAYIIDNVAPILTVAKQSDIVPKYDQSHWFRDGATLRLPRTRSTGGGWSIDKTDTYFCPRHSFRDEISDEERANADGPFTNLEADAVDFVSDKCAMRREISGAGSIFKTGVWTDKTGGSDFTLWSDYGGSSPLTDMTTYKDDVESRIGREPNRLVLGKQVWNILKWHPDLVDTVKYTQRGVISTDLAASLFEFDAGNLLIGRAIYTTDPEGTAEASVTYTRIWGKHALMLYVPQRPSLKQPAAMYTFVWAVVNGAIQYIKRMRDEEREVDIIEGNTYFVHKVTAARAGEFLSGAVA